MANLTTCLRKIGFSKAEAKLIKKAVTTNIGDGFTAKEAAMRVVQARLKEAQADKADIVDQLDYEKSKVVVDKPTEPTQAVLNQSGFYSQLSRAFEQAKQESMPGTQWAAWLKSNKSKLGIKDDEIHWSGINEYLELRGKEKVSKADVVEFLSESGVKVESDVLGTGGFRTPRDAPIASSMSYIEAQGFMVDQSPENPNTWGVFDPEGDTYVSEDEVPDLGYAELTEHVKKVIRYLNAHDERAPTNNTRFSDYIPPGGLPGTYREILVTLPSRVAPKEKEIEITKVRTIPNGDIEFKWVTRDGQSGTHIGQEGSTAESVKHDILVKLDIGAIHRLGQDFNTSHFDQPNILVHLRTDEVTGADGKRYLRVVEIQSDWGQRRKKEDAMRARGVEDGGAGAPAGPFIGKTEAWVSLGIKRAIQHAVSSGVDGIVFATGQQNADLYDLSKQVDSVTVTKLYGGKGWTVEAMRGGENVINKQVTNEQELADTIGKDLAGKAVADGGGEYSGLDLKVGGEGMRAFYDTIVPSVANDVLKKLGGGKVGSVAVQSETYVSRGLTDQERGRMAELNGMNNRGELSSRSAKPLFEELTALRNKEQAGFEATEAQQPGFLITDKMREAVHAGIPLFQMNRASINFQRGIGIDPTIINIGPGSDMSSFIHEAGHFFLEVYADLASRPDAPDAIRQRMETLLKWFGVPDLNTWHNMTLDEKRAHHEKFARAFEQYAFEGKSPRLDMVEIFRTFRNWLTKVYSNIKKFLDRFEGGKQTLNDDIRQVMDRMLATEEQIDAAQAARNYAPLFETQEEQGMTDAEWAEYQKDDAVARATGIEELERRGMKDLQWVRNARLRAMAKAKKENEGKIREVRWEIAREVMAQPIYQVWQFLKTPTPKKTKKPAPPAEFKPMTLEDADMRAMLVEMAKEAGWAQIGGRNMGTELGVVNFSQWIPNAEWWPGRPGPKKLSAQQTVDAVNKALAGETLKAREKDTVDYMIDWINEEAKQNHELTIGESQEADAWIADMEDVYGELADGQTYPSGKLSIPIIEQMYTEPEARDIKARLGTGKYGMLMKDGMDPDEVANLFGFTSGDAMVLQLMETLPPREAIDRLLDQRVLERYGDITSQQALEEAADQAVHNQARMRMVATELAVLSRRMGDKRALAAAAKAAAFEIVNRKKVRDIKPREFVASEGRATKNAEKAMKEGGVEMAAQAKRAQVLNGYAARMAYEALDEVATAIRYLNRITRPAALKNMRGEPRAQLLAILDRFDIRKSLSLKEIDRQQSLADWAVAEAERLAAPAPILSDTVANEAIRTHYKNLTVKEFRELIDSIKQLEHLARREHKAYIAIRNMTLQEEVAKSVAEIRDAWPDAFNEDGKAKTETPLTHRYAPTIGSRLKKGMQYANAEFVPMEELVDQLTAGKFGLLHDSLFGRISNASDKKSIMAGEIRDRLKPTYAAYSFQEKRDFSSKVVVDGMTRENLLMLALYYGNVEGRQRLASQGFGDQQVMQRLRHLTGKDINLAEAIWSLNDDYIWPMYAALHERTQGKALAKVQAVPMRINGRDVKGGYVKLVYDSAFDETTRRRDSMDDAMAMIGGRANMSAKTNQGSSIERVNEISKMPLLELRAMSQAVNEHMHDIAYREAVADTVRVLRDPTMRDAIKAVAGDPIYTELLAKVNEIAAQPRDPSSLMLKGINIARKNTVVVLMSGVKTALINYSGLVPAMLRVNAGSLVKNVAKIHSWRMREMIKFAMDSSIYMRERNQQYTSDLQHEMASLTVQNKLLPEMGTFLILMRLVDQMTSTIVWTTAYEDGMVEFKNHDIAVEYASNVTRGTQGSGRDVDTSKVMTRFGLWSKPFTMFYSFFNRQLALLVRQGVISKMQWNSGNRAEAVGRFTVAYMLVVVIPALINDLAQGKCDEAIAGNEGWTRCISKAITMNMSGLVPVVRDFVPYVWRKLDDSEPDYNLRMTPITSYFEGIGSGISSTVDYWYGEGDEKDTKAIFMGLAFSFGLPGKLMWDTTAGTEAVINDDAPPQSVLFGPPKD